MGLNKTAKMYLIAYDIEDNRTRTKISDMLIYFGMARLQYSVFAGPAVSLTYKLMIKWLASQKEQLKEGDKIFVIPLHRESLEKVVSFGQDKADLFLQLFGEELLFI